MWGSHMETRKIMLVALIILAAVSCIGILEPKGFWMCGAHSVMREPTSALCSGVKGIHLRSSREIYEKRMSSRNSFPGALGDNPEANARDARHVRLVGVGSEDESLRVDKEVAHNQKFHDPVDRPGAVPCDTTEDCDDCCDTNGVGEGGAQDKVKDPKMKPSESTLYGPPPKECYRILNATEPYSGWYTLKNQQVYLDGPQFAVFNWNGSISKETFRKSMGRFTPRIAFKILNSTLYVLERGHAWQLRHSLQFRLDSLIELLLLTIDRYKIPDMDFLVELKDEVDCGTASFTYSLDTSCTKSGFSIPSYGAYEFALGPQQMDEMFNCLEGRYPKSSRIQKGIWRGSSTGGHITEENYMDFGRVKLASLAQKSTKIMDAGLTDYVQLGNHKVKEILTKAVPLVRRIPSMELFNKFAAIFDLDGNGWSDRFSRLITYNTPILKQRSNFLQYFGHLLKNDEHVKFFEANLENAVPQLLTILQDYEEDKIHGKWSKLLSGMQQFAKEHTTHEGVARATAYGLNVYASKLTWEIKMEEGYVEIPMSSCCKKNPYLPKELLHAMRENHSR